MQTNPFKSVHISYTSSRNSETIIAKDVASVFKTLSEEQLNEISYVSVNDVNVLM